MIGNFIDEATLEPYRQAGARTGPYRFVYIGSLSRRKRPDLVVKAAAELKARGVAARIDILGGGPLLGSLERYAGSFCVTDMVHFAGHVADPYPILAAADCLILPSLSEGLSRAMLEALYLGVPCVARNVDGTGELISPGSNGFLFETDSDIATVMLRGASWARQRPTRHSLLPAAFAQRSGALQYLTLVEA